MLLIPEPPRILTMQYELPPLLGVRSSAWPKTRHEHLEKEPDCQICLCVDMSMLEVHHILPFHIYAGRELDPTNLITLCHFCHFLWGHGKNWKNFNPKIREHVIAFRKMMKAIKAA